MRNPERIDRIIRKIKRVWEAYPDLRICQLIEYVGQDVNMYYLEDEDFEERLENAYSTVLKEADATKLSLEDLHLNVRTYNTLMEQGITSVAELLQKSKFELENTKNFGPATIFDIQEKLGKYNLKLLYDAEPLKVKPENETPADLVCDKDASKVVEINTTPAVINDGQDTLNAMILDLIISIVSNPAIYNRRLANNVNTAVKQQEEIVKSKNKLM